MFDDFWADFNMRNLIPHWGIWILALIAIGSLNLLIVFGHKSATVTEANVTCNATDIIKSGDYVKLKITCHPKRGDVTDTVSSIDTILAIIKSPQSMMTCSVYQDNSIANCVVTKSND